MPSKESRKVIKLGGSKAISLPKPFLDYHKIEGGDKVLLLYDGIILILPESFSQEQLEKKADFIKGLLE